MKTLGRPLMLLLIAISAIGPMALNGVLPATTTIMVDLSTRFEVAQMVLTVFLAANLLSQLILGPAADRYGRRPVMLLSLTIFFLGSVACAMAQSIEWLLLARFIQGVGGAVCVFLPRTVVRDIYSQDKAASVIGYITTAMMVAPLFAPALGGWITDTYSWRYMYFGLAGLSMVLLFMCYRYQYETRRSSRLSAPATNGRTMFFSSSKILLSDRAFIACAVMQAGTVGVYYSFLAGAPYVAMEIRGMSASSYGIWFSMVAVGYLSGNLVAGRFSESQGVFRMVKLGAGPFALGAMLFWLGIASHHPITLFLPMFLVAFSNGVSLPSMFSIAMSVRPDLAASASGLSGSLQTALGVCLTLLIGYLLPFSGLWLYIVITASMILSMTGLLLTLRIQRVVTSAIGVKAPLTARG
ncbi:MAG: multidrug effflux MFS transporter [Granulosicoccus sp.]